MTQAFWKPQPKLPNKDWIAPVLKASLFVSALGWIVYGVFALAFDDIAVIPAPVQSWLVIAGSALIVAGAEMNTAPTVVAVARKWGSKEGQRLDAIAFAVSLIGSVTAGLIAFSIRQTRLGDSAWRILALNWGPLVAGVAIAADFYAASIELGLLRADFEREMEQWLDEKRTWESEHGRPRPPRPVFDPSWPVARLPDWKRITAGMNGNAPTTADGLVVALYENELNLPSESTGKRWLKMTRE
jgi:hypothetical protein